MKDEIRYMVSWEYLSGDVPFGFEWREVEEKFVDLQKADSKYDKQTKLRARGLIRNLKLIKVEKTILR